jgi:hypothetical protein
MKTLLKRLWSESAVAPCARPQDYLYEIDESFFTLFVGHEVIGGEIDRCLLNRVCDVAYREAIAFQVNLMDRDQAIEFIRTLLVKCDSLLSGKFFVSSCFALRLRDSFVVATIGRCESWLLHAHTVNRLTTNTILAAVPGVFLSVLGGTVPTLNANIQVVRSFAGLRSLSPPVELPTIAMTKRLSTQSLPNSMKPNFQRTLNAVPKLAWQLHY